MGSSRYKVRFLPSAKEVEVKRGGSLLDAARAAGIYLVSICGGEGTCGKCKVKVASGEVDFDPTGTALESEDAKAGYVLACQAKVTGDITVDVPAASELTDEKIEVTSMFHSAPGGELDPPVKRFYLELSPPTVEDYTADIDRLIAAIRSVRKQPEMVVEIPYQLLKQLPQCLRDADWRVTATIGCRGDNCKLLSVTDGNSSSINPGIALDVGTTTLVAELVNLATGESLGTQTAYNPQMAYGEDYIARIMYAEEHNAFGMMKDIVLEKINELITELAAEAGLETSDIFAVVCAGNTAMMHFLLGLDARRIRREPYIPTANQIAHLGAAEVGFATNPAALLYPLPSVAAYVGSDITAGAALLAMHTKESAIFIDVGTNGEIALSRHGALMCTSCSAGPAFEGGGISCGMRATAGAIEEVKIRRENGEFRVELATIGNKPPCGICGSGLIDCVAELFRASLLDRAGKLQPHSSRVRQLEVASEFVLADKSETGTDSEITLTEMDIEHLIRSKAAVYAAINILLASAGMDRNDISTLYLAGGFGSNVDVRNVITIGMLPDIGREKIIFAGNTSLAGAKAALLSQHQKQRVEQLASQLTYIDLMGSVEFMDQFTSASFLPHTDLSQFPSVE